MNKLQIKDSAYIHARHFDPCMIPIWVVALETAPQMEDEIVWVTDGHRLVGVGYHPQFRALDFRTRNIIAENDGERTEEAIAWQRRMRKRLGIDYDVVLEDDHMHVECDPKGD